MRLRHLSDHLYNTLLDGYEPQRSLVCSIEGDEGEGGGSDTDGASDGGDPGTDDGGDSGDEGSGDDGKGFDLSDITADQLKELPAVQELIAKERKKAENAKAAELRRKRKQQKNNKPNNSNPKPPADEGSDISEQLQGMFSSLKEELAQEFKQELTALGEQNAEKQRRSEYDAMMAEYGVKPKLANRLYEDFKGAKPKEPEKWIATELEDMGAQVPKSLRKQVQLKAVGPKGTRDLEMVGNVHDLSGDELKALGSRKVRQMWDRQHGQGRAGNPFVRQKD